MMENLHIAGVKLKSPEIVFDAQKGSFEISGMSSCENAPEFYRPVIDWLEQYADSENRPKKIEANIKYKYFNTSSAKCIIDVLEKITNLHYAGSQVAINWFYEPSDEEMIEAGENFSDLLEFKFNFVEQA